MSPLGTMLIFEDDHEGHVHSGENIWADTWSGGNEGEEAPSLKVLQGTFKGRHDPVIVNHWYSIHTTTFCWWWRYRGWWWWFWWGIFTDYSSHQLHSETEGDGDDSDEEWWHGCSTVKHDKAVHEPLIGCIFQSVSHIKCWQWWWWWLFSNAYHDGDDEQSKHLKGRSGAVCLSVQTCLDIHTNQDDIK